MTAPITIECYDPNDRLMPLDTALESIISEISRSNTAHREESVSLMQANGRILARQVTAAVAVPPYDNSAMDGYGINSRELAPPDSRWQIIGEAMAGRPFSGHVKAGQAIKIMTGAIVPDGVNCVIAQENATHRDGMVEFSDQPREGSNIRRAGEDIAIGDIVLNAGDMLTPARLGVLASIGNDPVPCSRRPRVIVFSTGDELRQPGETLAKGQIYDSNRYLLNGLLTRLGLEITDGGVISDDRETLDTFLSQASKSHDVIITSGGASTGDADHIAAAIDALGQLAVWRIALRPGRPFAHGRIGNAQFFGLPGNPVAVAVTFYQMVQPILKAMMGANDLQIAPLIPVKAGGPFRKKPGRAEVYRAVLCTEPNGELSVSTTGKQGSGILTSMANANCFVLLDHDAPNASPGDTVMVQPFYGLV